MQRRTFAFLTQIEATGPSLFLIALFSILVGLSGISFGKIIFYATNGVKNSNLNQINLGFKLLVINSIFFGLFSFARSYLSMIFAEKVASSLYLKTYKSIIFSNFYFKKSGSLINSALQDIALIKSFLATQASYGIRNLLMAVCSMFAIIYLMPKIIIFAFLMTVFILITVKLIMIFTLGYSERINKIKDELHRNIYESIFAIKTIKTFCSAAYELLIFNEKKISLMVHSRRLFFFRCVRISIIISSVLIFASIAINDILNDIFNQRFSAGQAASFFFYIIVCVSSFIGISYFRNEYESFKQAVERFKKLTQNKFEVDCGMDVSHPDIKMNNVGYAVDKAVILKDFCCDIPYGSKVLISGKSGSGKSTLCDILIGVIKPQIGSVKIGETEENNYCNIFSISEQDPIVFTRSLIENIRYNSDTDDVEIIDLINKFELNHLLNLSELNPSSLSGGERQRISIARCLTRKNAKIFIFDESINSVEKNMVEVILTKIEESCAGKTVIFISHNMELFSKKVDLVINL